MSAYVIVDIEVLAPEEYQDYIAAAPATAALGGGCYLACSSATETLEGNWHAKRLVILEFLSAEQAKAWLNLPEYAGSVAP